jgi:hypothetical protein
MEDTTIKRDTGESQFSSNPLLRAALAYARRGRRVIPLHNPVVDGCSCGDPSCKHVGKHPRTDYGVKDATTDPTQISKWWKESPGANIGLATGPESGLLVLDLDGMRGLKSYMRLQAEYGIPATLMVRSGRVNEDGLRVGWHLYFKWPKGWFVCDSVGRIGANIDVRGDGGYIIAPPSMHSSSRRYRLHDPEQKIAELPEQVVELLAHNETNSIEFGPVSSITDEVWENKLYRRGKSLRRDGKSLEVITETLLALNRTTSNVGGNSFAGGSVMVGVGIDRSVGTNGEDDIAAKRQPLRLSLIDGVNPRSIESGIGHAGPKDAE